MLLAAVPSRESDVERATISLLEESRDVPAPNVLDGVRCQDIRGCDDDPKMIDNQFSILISDAGQA